jgi:hypothetical protein
MAKTNGSHPPLPSRSTETANFRIGGVDIAVPALTLYVLEVCKEDIQALSPGLDSVAYARHVCSIVAACVADDRPELTLDVLVKSCSFSEIGGLIESMGELLRVSGFLPSGEELAAGEEASPGTGTSTSSSPNSESEASAPAIPS